MRESASRGFWIGSRKTYGYNRVNRYIANQDLTPVITDLIERSIRKG